MWDLPGPGIESMSPAWAGGFLTTVPSGKSLAVSFFFLNMERFTNLRVILAQGPR